MERGAPVSRPCPLVLSGAGRGSPPTTQVSSYPQACGFIHRSLTWDRGDQVRHVLAVNIAVSPGTHYIVAWATPAGQWDSQAAPRTAAVDSFLPPS